MSNKHTETQHRQNTHTHRHIHTYTQAQKQHKCIHTHTYTHTYIHTDNTYIHTYAHTYIQSKTCIHMGRHKGVNDCITERAVHTQIYLQTYIHTSIQTDNIYIHRTLNISPCPTPAGKRQFGTCCITCKTTTARQFHILRCMNHDVPCSIGENGLHTIRGKHPLATSKSFDGRHRTTHTHKIHILWGHDQTVSRGTRISIVHTDPPWRCDGAPLTEPLGRHTCAVSRGTRVSLVSTSNP